MKTTISFEIHYNTRIGENLYVVGSIPELGSEVVQKAAKMNYSEGKWNLTLRLKESVSFTYSYILTDDHGKIVPEAGASRHFNASIFNSYSIFDQWRSFNEETPFLSNAFKNIFFKSPSRAQYLVDEVVITCASNNLEANETLMISGNTELLGKWSEERALDMHPASGGLWFISFKKKDLLPFNEYKFIIKKTGDSLIYKWENGLNRQIPKDIANQDSQHAMILNHSINLTSAMPKYAGTAIPVFSLRSEQSVGIGEFLDIIPFSDILAKTGQKVLQILPVNDTTMKNTWEDSYPYGAISIFALHPLYINLQEAGKIKDKEFLHQHNKDADKLNSLEKIDYDQVALLKWKYLRKLYLQDGTKTLNSPKFKAFFKNNNIWLKPYASFSYLRDKYGTVDFSKWEEYSIYNQKEIDNLTSPGNDSYNEIALYFFIQYHLDRQLKIAHEYVNSKGIILKGDIPIGINRNSVEAWYEPHYFNFTGQAGAPPDDFSVKGQNWGFPTYNWNAIEIEGCEWWKRRLQKMAEYFDAYRIDHILGFFRIWEIPINAIDGLLGYFNPSLPFTEDEIRILGYNFNFERDCNPFIRDYLLKDYFNEDFIGISNLFFDNIESNIYKFKPQFSSQRAIEDYFLTNPDNTLIKHKETLFSLITNVLFIQDPYDNSKYHPRISAQFTQSYFHLPDWMKEVYNKVYDLFFYHRNDGFWYNNALKKLPSLISSTDMLVCGEDLGMIPSCVPSAMKSLSILSLEIERMPKDPKEKFGKTFKYPYLSVCTTGTHDTSTIRGWWEENHSLSQDYYNNILGENGDAPYFCEPWICKKIIKNHLDSPSMLTILPLQDWLSIFPDLRKEDSNSERINIPANPKHYWRYRMHFTISKLSESKQFISEVTELIKKSGR